jgi:hypothetical protein
MRDFKRHAVDGLKWPEEAVKVMDGDSGTHETLNFKL